MIKAAPLEPREMWKVVPSHPHLEASNLGRIRLAVDTKNGRYKWATGKHKRGFCYTPRERLGYLSIRTVINGIRKQLQVNRLVCEAFHGLPPTGGMHAAHINGVSRENYPSNLYWATPAQNIEDRESHGNTMRGDRHYAARLKSSDIPVIRKLLNAGVAQTEIGKKYKVSNYAIHDIQRGKSWKSA